MKVLFLLFSFLIYASANSQNLTLDYLKKQPKGISRDFYIWLFLQQDINPKEATEAYNLALRKNAKLFGLYYKKGDNKILSKETICQQMELQKLIKQDSQCIAYGLTLQKAEKLEPKTLLQLSQKLQKTDQILATQLKILASQNPFNELIKTNVEVYSSFYFGVSSYYRKRFLNAALPKRVLLDYISQKHPPFMRLIRLAILNPDMKVFSHSLMQISPKETLLFLDDESAFYLGLNAIRNHNNIDSLSFFIHSLENARYSFEKNRGLFWAYLASKDSSYLQELSQSKSMDLYTLAALELTNNKPQFEILYDIQTSNTLAKWDIKDPFEWEKIRDSYKNQTPKDKEALLQKVNHLNTKPHFFWLNKQANKEYFLKPFPTIMKQFNNDTQALLYALGRQESLFIPTAISTSYALGVMQLMPFNVTAIAKQMGESEKITYQDMFDPAINIPYAEYFTRPLLKEFKHPLFISYAYNGGPGFTRRLLETKQLFKKDNPLDPWYSMEMIPYEETRKYGKKVLANYIIYQKSFGKEIDLQKTLQDTLIY